jgi:TetR/AcrR family transcriptional regulator, transcriptional repressor of bet genes
LTRSGGWGAKGHAGQTAGDRRKFRREGEERRREALMAQRRWNLMAEGGVSGATVRAIAERAGVTPGLIRHYFESARTT